MLSILQVFLSLPVPLNYGHSGNSQYCKSTWDLLQPSQPTQLNQVNQPSTKTDETSRYWRCNSSYACCLGAGVFFCNLTFGGLTFKHTFHLGCFDGCLYIYIQTSIYVYIYIYYIIYIIVYHSTIQLGGKYCGWSKLTKRWVTRNSVLCFSWLHTSTSLKGERN